jgi:hypothetical protein
MNARWPIHAVPGAKQALTEAEAALLVQLQRRPHALNKRERDQLVRLQRKAAAEAAALAVPSQPMLRSAGPRHAEHCHARPRRAPSDDVSPVTTRDQL